MQDRKNDGLNPLDKLLAQDAPQADTESPMWGMLRDDEDDDELEFHDGRSTQIGCSGVDGEALRLPLQMPATVVSAEALNDEVTVSDPRWVWDSMDEASELSVAEVSASVAYHGEHDTRWVGERPERVISRDAEKIADLIGPDDSMSPRDVAYELGWPLYRVEAIIEKELS